MKQIQKTLLLFLLLASTLSANADTVDNFQIKIRNKLLLNESGFGSALPTRNLLILKQSDRDDILTITYSHCTRGVDNRKIILKDSSGTVLYVWSFHPESTRPEMGIPISNIIDLIRDRSFFSLFYSDSLSKEEIFLSLLEIDNKNHQNVLKHYKAKSN
jgi:hypothetical protein